MVLLPFLVEGPLGVYRRCRVEDSVFFNFGHERNGYRRGYLFTYVMKGHESCGCLRSKRVAYFSFHVQQSGSWPNNYLVSQLRGEELAELLGQEYCLIRTQYVLVRPAD